MARRLASGLSFVSLALAVVLAGLTAVATLGWQVLSRPLDVPAGGTLLRVESGETYTSLINDLQKKHGLQDPWAARLYRKLFINKPLKTGVYRIEPGTSTRQLLDQLASGKVAEMVRITLIEGHTFAQFFAQLEKKSGIDHELKGKSAAYVASLFNMPGGRPEGWLTPDTYFFAQGTSDKAVIEHLYKIRKNELASLWAARAPDLPYTTPYEALIMASIVEKETSVPAERFDVAAVFVNRLRKPMRLQTDPTVIYGLVDQGRYDGNIRRTDLAEKTAYNTYQIDGLPPTPIAMPSKASIEAALHPSDSQALYFVATGQGGHAFAKTLAEHNANVARYLAQLRANRAAQKQAEQNNAASASTGLAPAPAPMGPQS